MGKDDSGRPTESHPIAFACPRSKSRNPPALPSNITRQQLTFVEVKPGIPLRMSYPLTAVATAYAIDVVTGADADHVRSS